MSDELNEKKIEELYEISKRSLLIGILLGIFTGPLAFLYVWRNLKGVVYTLIVIFTSILYPILFPLIYLLSPVVIFLKIITSRSKVRDRDNKIAGEISGEILKNMKLDEGIIDRIKKLRKSTAIVLFDNVYNSFVQDKELDESEIRILNGLIEFSVLSRDDVKYVDRVLPYWYAYHIKKYGALPDVTGDVISAINSTGTTLVLSKGEKVFLSCPAKLMEMRVVSLGYKGGSTGVSIRIAKGVTYRVGSHKGHVVKENRLVRTSEGVLILTNKRLLLIPTQGSKRVNLQLKSIELIRGYENGVEIWKSGRQKPFFFEMSMGYAEILEMALNFLIHT